jgi:1-acyl-sn-glycerol-3-phosphate acyltransferase
LTFPRFIICVLQLFYELPLSKLIIAIGGHEPGKPLKRWQKAFLVAMTKLCSQMILWFGPAMFWYRREREKVDYKPYLGPDWVPTYEGASTIVANHSGWCDIVLITLMKFPSFTPKLGIKNWPFIGQICDLVFDSYFINRAGTPEERQKIIIDIGERQKKSEAGLAAPLIMYPEGCTTNNSELITFRRGAFAALHSV